LHKDWIAGRDGRNLKFKREALLNYGLNRWALNKAHSVGPTSELIRKCSPKTFEEWEQYYFDNAVQKKRDGVRITRQYLKYLGQRLYIKLSEVVRSELDAIEEDECIDYVYNLVLNRTYEGYKSEVETVYGQAQDCLNMEIHAAPDQWDRKYCVDFYIQVGSRHIGLQIKPISSGLALDQYQWDKMHEVKHQKFTEDHGGKVFFIYSVKAGGKKKQIYNTEVIAEIRAEIERLKKLES